MPTKHDEGDEGRRIDRSLIGVREAAVIAIFFASHAVSWGFVLSGNSERDEKISELNHRVMKQEEAVSRLMTEVTKVSRDTEWIRDYLSDRKKPPTP